MPIALRLAQQRPDLVTGLVLFDGPASWPPRLSWEGRLLARSRLARAVTGLTGAVFALETVRRGYRRARPPLGVVLDHVRSAAGPRRFSRQLAFVGSYHRELPVLQARLRDVRVPVLVTWGLDDPFVLADEGHALAAALPRASWEPLVGCGHYAHEDAGPVFTAMVRAFASRC